MKTSPPLPPGTAESDTTLKRNAARAAVQEMLDLYLYIVSKQNFSGYDVKLMQNLKLVDAWPEGRVEWELHITPYYANLNGVMHGGAAGVIFDMTTTTALCPIQRPGYWDFMGGVTRSLNISYLRAIPVDTRVRIRSTLVQHGRTMAMMRGTMESVDGKSIYATVEHHKVNVPSIAEHLQLREEMRKVKVKSGREDGLEKKALGSESAKTINSKL